MADKILVLPFIVEEHDGKEDVTCPTEVACVVCITELQRKKTGFLRDNPEKVSFITKIHYPILAVPMEDQCIIMDGLASSSYKFVFEEPANTTSFVEDLQRNSVAPQEFMAALKKQTRNTGKLASSVDVPFRALIVDRKILDFFLECFRNGSFLSGDQDEKAVLIPMENDEKTAAETREALTNCLRRINANVRGLQYALGVLNGEVEFHQRMLSNEVELLKERCEAEVSGLKLEAEKKITKLKLERDTTFMRIQKDAKKKADGLEKKREGYQRRLRELERRKESLRKRKESTRSVYEMEKGDREIDNVRKEISALYRVIENTRKEANKSIKEVGDEFRRSVAKEEEKTNLLSSVYESKIGEKKNQLAEMASETATITKSFESLIDRMKREASVFNEQVSLVWNIADLAIVGVPIYLIGYARGNKERYSLFSPMSISEDASVLKELHKILTLTPEPRLRLLMRQRSDELHEMLSSQVIKRMQNEQAFRQSMNGICRANNLLEREDFEKTLDEGLTEVGKKRWITAEEAAMVKSGIKGEEK